MSKILNITDTYLSKDNDLYLIVDSEVANTYNGFFDTITVPECLFSRVRAFVHSFSIELAELKTSGKYDLNEYHESITRTITNILAPHYPDIPDLTIKGHVSASLYALDY